MKNSKPKNSRPRKGRRVRQAIKATESIVGNSPQERAALDALHELHDKRQGNSPIRFAEATRMIDLAMDEVGYHEGKTGGQWNNRQKYAQEVPGLGWADGQPWCATFVAWLAMKAGVADLFPRTASCDVAAAWFKARGQWSEYPAIGAQVFYGTPADLNHTGIVVSFDGEHIYTVEGNTNTNGSREGDGVYRKTRRRRDANVVGYGYPAYPGGIEGAR